MTIIFMNFKELEFEHYNATNKLELNNFQLFCLFRDTFFEAHCKKTDIPQDIKAWEHTIVPEKLRDSSSDVLSLYNFSVSGAQNILQEWQKGHQQAYVVYKNINGMRVEVGLAIFEEKYINGKHFVYIVEAGVYERGKGIGHALMDCVLMHYPEKTEFLIGTRIFNNEAIGLYQNCLKFESLSAQETKKYMGLDERYCGFSHTTSKEELSLICNKIRPVNNLKHLI
jgi:ribosomal protein S18 acetylase RimI-like enzyme